MVRGSEELGKPLDHGVLTVGNFDGLHLGHQSIMETVRLRASALGGPAAAFTFEPHPRRVLHPEHSPKLLTTLEQKLELFEAAGVEVAIVEPFDLEFARLPAERFVREILHARIGPSEVYVGYDFRYGRDREGSMRTLTELGPHLGFSVTIIPEVKLGDRDVNSTRIRELLEEGQVEDAAVLLGRPYTVRGTVAEGDRRGRTIGFPTANLAPENEILPARGVYAGHIRFLNDGDQVEIADQVEIGDQEVRSGDPAAESRFPVVTNVGKRPTFKQDDPVLAEAHVIDFDADVYGRRVEFTFEYCLRAEERFPDVEALKAQIARDVIRARELLGSDG